MKKITGFLIGAGAFALPLLAFAAVATEQTFGTNLMDIVGRISVLINYATPVIVALALVFFFWGLAVFILNSADEKKRKGGIQLMIWGIIALFVMVSIWGIINVLASTFGTGTGGAANVPGVNQRPAGTSNGGVGSGFFNI